MVFHTSITTIQTLFSYGSLASLYPANSFCQPVPPYPLSIPSFSISPLKQLIVLYPMPFYSFWCPFIFRSTSVFSYHSNFSFFFIFSTFCIPIGNSCLFLVSLQFSLLHYSAFLSSVPQTSYTPHLQFISYAFSPLHSLILDVQWHPVILITIMPYEGRKGNRQWGKEDMEESSPQIPLNSLHYALEMMIRLLFYTTDRNNVHKKKLFRIKLD